MQQKVVAIVDPQQSSGGRFALVPLIRPKFRGDIGLVAVPVANLAFGLQMRALVPSASIGPLISCRCSITAV